MRRGPLRGAAAELLISLGVLALALGAILSVARRALFYPDAFADRLAASLEDPRVAAFVADRTGHRGASRRSPTSPRSVR